MNEHLRERREHRVFSKLLQMVPSLEERLVGSSEPEVVLIADLVSLRYSVVIQRLTLCLRSRKEPLAPDQTTQKVLKALSLIGLLRGASHSILLYLGTSRSIVASTTSVRVHCSVLRDWTGRIMSSSNL